MAYHYTNKQNFLTSAARTSSGQSSGWRVDGWREGLLLVNITAASGTLSIRLDVSFDDSTYYTVEDFGPYQFASTGQYAIPISNFGRYFRIRYTIAGTSASFTFAVDFVGKT